MNKIDVSFTFIKKLTISSNVTCRVHDNFLSSRILIGYKSLPKDLKQHIALVTKSNPFGLSVSVYSDIMISTEKENQ